jgi:hypothetical protein
MLALPFIIYANLTRTLQIHLFLNYKPLRINPMSYLTLMSYILCLIEEYSYVLYLMSYRRVLLCLI